MVISARKHLNALTFILLRKLK